MRDELLLYYERELTYIRRMAAQFAEKYPKVAARLVLEPDACNDPHVERLIESFAFLAARVHLKIDDDFPEVSEALLNVVYPHFVRPIPSMSIVEMEIDPEQGKLSTGLVVERESTLYSRPVAGAPCKFRTAYETTLWPISVAAAMMTKPELLDPPIASREAAAAVRVELRGAPDIELGALDMESLRFYLNGEPRVVYRLYELLCSRLIEVVVRDPSPGSRRVPVRLPPNALRPVGFEPDEGMLPYPGRSFVGYRLLQELFSFPEKFLFVELRGLAQALAGFGGAAELVFLLRPFEGADVAESLETGVSAQTFRLGCTPIVNLFPQQAEPLLIRQRKYEYPIIPDVRRPLAVEVFSVDRVSSINLTTQETTIYEPFYSFRHSKAQTKGKAFWAAHRRASMRPNDAGADMMLSLTNLAMEPVAPDADTLVVHTSCTNRDLPVRLPFGDESGDFELEDGVSIKRIVCLRKPTSPIRPALGKGIMWRLLSHLSLNYLSIVEGGRESLQQILRLYNFTDSTHTARMIEGIVRVDSKRHFAPVLAENGVTFCQGTKVEIEFDEEKFVGGGVYLFAGVIERFLGLYASLNSFTQLSARTQQRREALREWKPRAGGRILA